MMYSLRRYVNSFLFKLGYEVRKIPKVEYTPLDIFRHIVTSEYLSKEKSEEFFIVQVGANDGSFSDPLRNLINRYKWKGILIEPQPDVFQRLKNLYKNEETLLSFVNCAISTHSGWVQMYRMKQESLNSNETYQLSVSSIDAHLTAKQLGIPKGDLEAIEVPCKTLTQVLDDLNVNSVSLLQIDTEGHDLEVLRS